jgi:hypothetical protein
VSEVISTLEALSTAIDELDPPVDGTVPTETFAVADRLNANCSPRWAVTIVRRCGATTLPPP